MLKATYSVVAECLARAADARANAQAATDLQTKRSWHTLEASCSHDARDLTLAAGAIACLFKPVDSDMLLDAIERAIGNR